MVPSACSIYGRWDYLRRAHTFYQPIRIGVMRLMLLRAAAGVHPIVRHLTRYYEREQN